MTDDDGWFTALCSCGAGVVILHDTLLPAVRCDRCGSPCRASSYTPEERAETKALVKAVTGLNREQRRAARRGRG